ncbi:MAG: hypothetical protein WC603_02100 [Candidatus Paceibacterota bacterium]
MRENNYQKYIQFLKKVLIKLRPRFSFHYIAYTTLFTLIIFSVIQLVSATTPNPGHPWSELGDGVFVFTNSQTVTPYTYTFPAANSTVLTTNAAVTVGQGGTGLNTIASGSILAANALDTLSAITSTTGTKVLKNTAGTISWETDNGMVYPGAGIPNSTGSAWGTSYSTTGTGTVVALATSPSFTTPSLGVASGTSIDLGTTTLLGSRALTVDTGGVFNINMGTAAGDDFTVDTDSLVVEGDTGRVGIGISTPASILDIRPNTGLTDVGLNVRQTYTDAGSGNFQTVLRTEDRNGTATLSVDSRGQDGATKLSTGGAWSTFAAADAIGYRYLTSSSGAQGMQAKYILVGPTYSSDISTLSAGGIYGGMIASKNLLLESTSHATKGYVLIQSGGGNTGVGGISTPTARLHLPAGAFTVSAAPLKFTAGTNLLTAEAGAMEWDGTNLFITQTTGPTRKRIAYGSGTANEIPYWVDSSTLGTLTTATYPSLTELSYVKGTTSAIQTQFTGKANTALSNLASVAINTSLVSDTNSTDDLGSSSVYWANTYTNTIYVNATKIGGTAVRGTTEGTNHLDIFDGTAPVGTLTNGISLYSTAGELRVMDAAGNATLLSPHENINNYWVFDSTNQGTGKSLVIDMELMMKKLNETFGWDFVHETQDGISIDTLMAGLETNIVTDTFEANGEVTFNGLAFFNENVNFAKGIKFSDVAEFEVPPLFNNDTAGFAIIKEGAKSVQVSFENPYLTTPVVATNITFEKNEDIEFNSEDFFNQDVESVVMDKDQEGFTIALNQPAPVDINFSWVALAVKDVKVYESAIEGLVIEDIDTGGGDTTEDTISDIIEDTTDVTDITTDDTIVDTTEIITEEIIEDNTDITTEEIIEDNTDTTTEEIIETTEETTDITTDQIVETISSSEATISSETSTE